METRAIRGGETNMSEDIHTRLFREVVTDHCAGVVARNMRNGFPDGSMNTPFESVTTALMQMDWDREARETRPRDLMRRVLFPNG